MFDTMASGGEPWMERPEDVTWPIPPPEGFTAGDLDTDLVEVLRR